MTTLGGIGHMGGIGGCGGAGGLEGPRRLAEAVPQVHREFEAVLGELHQKLEDPEGLVRQAGAAAPDPAPGGDLEARLRTEVQQPGGAERILGRLEQGQARLSELLNEVQGGRVYSTQELLGVQAEIQQISGELSVASKVVAEVTTGIKTLLQQQV